jgi:hypothetical protein
MNEQETKPSKQEELTDDLERFKSMFQFPKLFLSTYFSELRNKIDVAFVCKTWWTDSSIKNIKGYSLYQKSRVGVKRGGVCKQ